MRNGKKSPLWPSRFYIIFKPLMPVKLMHLRGGGFLIHPLEIGPGRTTAEEEEMGAQHELSQGETR